MCGSCLGQQVGQTAAISAALASHLVLLSAAEGELSTRVRLEELPEAVMVPADAAQAVR